MKTIFAILLASTVGLLAVDNDLTTFVPQKEDGYSLYMMRQAAAIAADYNAKGGQLLTVSTLTTNSATNTINISTNTYHVININSATNDGLTVTLDRSIDGTNWVPFLTNEVSAIGTTETTMTGKWAYIRARCIRTNGTHSITYYGGR